MSSAALDRLDGRTDPSTARRPVFRTPVRATPRRDQKPAPRRSLPGYLLVPRPKDLSKAVLLPTTFGIGVLATGGTDTRSVLRALVVLAALELLIYAARYQWNDVRGFVADQRHPDEAERGRLPGPPGRGRRHVLVSCAVAVARLAALPLLALAAPGLDLWPLLGWVALAVFGVAVAYEALRSWGTGRSASSPPPVRPALVLIWVTVGAGYAVRGLVGLALAVDLSDRPALGAAAGLTLWCGGVLFVTTRWAVEATAFGRVRHGEVHWTADAGHAREHQLALARWLPSRVHTVASTGDAGAPLATWAPLRDATPPTAPWNLALLLGAASAGLTGALLAGASSALGLGLPALVAAAAAWAVAGEPRRRRTVVALGALALGATLLTLAAPTAPEDLTGADAVRVLAGVLPWLVLAVAYRRFSGHALRPAGRHDSALRRLGRRVLGPPGRLVLGRTTWDLLTEGERR